MPTGSKHSAPQQNESENQSTYNKSYNGFCTPAAVNLPGIPGSRLRIHAFGEVHGMIRKLKSGEYRLYSRKKDAKTGKRRNLGTFSTREKAQAHERAVQFFKRAG